MSTVAAARLAPSRVAARLRAGARAVARPRHELGGLLVLAGVLNLWGLTRNGWANEYYSAAVRSMSSSWHAFLYGSFDPSGVMTVDKPPLALWIQVAFVKAFGYHPLSMLVPQALMGVGAGRDREHDRCAGLGAADRPAGRRARGRRARPADPGPRPHHRARRRRRRAHARPGDLGRRDARPRDERDVPRRRAVCPGGLRRAGRRAWRLRLARRPLR